MILASSVMIHFQALNLQGCIYLETNKAEASGLPSFTYSLSKSYFVIFTHHLYSALLEGELVEQLPSTF